jgi:hypothetical protein
MTRLHARWPTLPPALDPNTPQARPASLTPAQLARAQLKGAWELLAEACEASDLLPSAVVAPLAQALASLMEARVLLAQGTDAIGNTERRDDV